MRSLVKARVLITPLAVVEKESYDAEAARRKGLCDPAQLTMFLRALDGGAPYGT
jgi:hypothetical protein